MSKLSITLLGIIQRFGNYIAAMAETALATTAAPLATTAAPVVTALAVWWSQIRPVQDSYESGTATVAVPDSYRVKIRLCY